MNDIFDMWHVAEDAKPCPFCGKQPSLGPSAMNGEEDLEWAMECDGDDHMVGIHRAKKEDVIKAWNDGMANKEA